MSSSRKSKGRQKIQMKKMTNESNLQVTFSKRRSGLFKKASELCTLCAVEVGLIVFSPGEKVYSFGHPSIEALIRRYVTGAPPHAAYSNNNNSSMRILEAQRNANICELNAQLTDLTKELEAEKKHVEELNKLRMASQAACWWAAPIDEMNIPQLNQFKFALQELKKIVACHSDNLQLIQNAINQTPSIPSQMLQTSILFNNGADLGFNMMNVHYCFNNMGGYGPAAGGGFY